MVIDKAELESVRSWALKDFNRRNPGELFKKNKLVKFFEASPLMFASERYLSHVSQLKILFYNMDKPIMVCEGVCPYNAVIGANAYTKFLPLPVDREYYLPALERVEGGLSLVA